MSPSDWPPLDGIPDNVLQLWAIFDHPLDFPHHFVVRRQFGMPWREGLPGGPDVVMDVVPRLASTLAEARALVPQGLYCQPRQMGDDAFIVETWF